LYENALEHTYFHHVADEVAVSRTVLLCSLDIHESINAIG
jgi:hypothetical protein